MKSVFIDIFSGRGLYNFWDTRFLPHWLPLLMALGLGVFLALLIIFEAWLILVATLLFVPGVIILSRYPFAAVLIWLLVLPFFVKTPSTTERYVFWLLHRFMIPTMLGFVILTKRLDPKKKVSAFRPGLPEWAMVFFLVFALGNIFLLSPSPIQMAIRLLDTVFVPFCMYWFIRLVAPKEKDWKHLLLVAFFVIIIQSAIGLISWYAPSVLPNQWLGLEGSRTVGTLGNPAVYSSTLLFLSLVLLQHAIQNRSSFLRIVLFAVFSLALLSVFFTFSRDSWLGAIAVLLGLLIVYPNIFIRFVFIFVMFGIILSSTLFVDQTAWALERLTYQRTAEGRIIGWNAGFKMMTEKPLFGWGYGNYDRYDKLFRTTVGYIPVRDDVSSHNTYLTILAEMGIVVFLIYIFPLVYWFFASTKTWRLLPKQGFLSWHLLAFLWLVIINHIIVSNFMDMVRNHPFGTTIWWMVLGLIANLVYPYLRSRQTAYPRGELAR